MASDFNLDEIRKRQKELVEMKKVKQGQIEAPQVDLEAEKIVPHTAKEKRQNFWYHYKWVTIGVVLLVALGSFFIYDMITKPQYDIHIMSFNKYQPAISQTVLEKTFQPFVSDIDGDGSVKVMVDGGPLHDPTVSNSVNPQLLQASTTKLFAGLQTFQGFIFLLDENCYNNIVTESDTGEKADIFLDLSAYSAQNPAFVGDKLYLKDTGLLDSWGFEEAPDDLFLCLRDFDKYQSEEKKDSKRMKELQAQYETEKQAFDKIVRAVLDGSSKKQQEPVSSKGE